MRQRRVIFVEAEWTPSCRYRCARWLQILLPLPLHESQLRGFPDPQAQSFQCEPQF